MLTYTLTSYVDFHILIYKLIKQELKNMCLFHSLQVKKFFSWQGTRLDKHIKSKLVYHISIPIGIHWKCSLCNTQQAISDVCHKPLWYMPGWDRAEKLCRRSLSFRSFAHSLVRGWRRLFGEVNEWIQQCYLPRRLIVLHASLSYKVRVTRDYNWKSHLSS